MSVLLVLPLLVSFATALACAAARGRARLERSLSLGGALALLASTVWLAVRIAGHGPHALALGGWPPLFAITLAADLLGAILCVLAAVVGLAALVHSLEDLYRDRERQGFHSLTHLLLFGACGAFLTADIFNLYVFFEVVLITSFVLLSVAGGRRQLAGAASYVAMNLLSSALFLAAAGLLYGATGSLNLAEIARRPDRLAPDDATATPLLLLFIAAFAIKAALVPVHAWLPASYSVAPLALAGLLAGLMTKVGVYALVRVLACLHGPPTGGVRLVLLTLAGLTMLSGVLGAVASRDVRRILSFHAVSQVGYMVLGVALFTPLALAGTVVFVVHHGLIKSSLFLGTALTERACGTSSLQGAGGGLRSSPTAALLFALPALALAGPPPTSGFFAKLLLIEAGLEAEVFLLVAVAVLTGLLTWYSMIKIWIAAYWAPTPLGSAGGTPSRRALVLIGGPTAALTIVGLAVGFAAGPVIGVALDAAHQLLDPTGYVAAVLQAAR